MGRIVQQQSLLTGLGATKLAAASAVPDCNCQSALCNTICAACHTNPPGNEGSDHCKKTSRPALDFAVVSAVFSYARKPIQQLSPGNSHPIKPDASIVDA